MRKNNHPFPLIAESHPENYNGYEFITLIRYNDVNYLTVVDNIVNNQIIVYVLDECNQNKIDEEELINIINIWHSDKSKKYPLSIEFSRLGIADKLSIIMKSFSVDYVSRVIGPLPEFNMGAPFKVKKRQRKSIPKNVQFIDRTI